MENIVKDNEILTLHMFVEVYIPIGVQTIIFFYVSLYNIAIAFNEKWWDKIVTCKNVWKIQYAQCYIYSFLFSFYFLSIL